MANDSTTLLNKVKLSLQLSDSTFDTELTGYIASAKTDLGFGNVDTISESDDLTATAIVTYCSWMFHLVHGDQPRAKDLLVAYNSLKTQMGTSSSYRDWGTDDE